MKILLGSDPELFVFKGGAPISAHGMVDGSKEKPLIVQDGAVQVDGMALEYNTDPATTLEQWEHNHVSVQKQLEDMLEKGLSLKATPTAFFAEEVFNTTPAEALELGCEPDYNAYTGMSNPKPNAKVKFRTGAGHIHVGWTEGADIKDPFHLGECRALTKALDMYLGMPSITMDADAQRRQLYGKAGCFRPKSYGLEYRTLSNFWVKDKELRAWAYQNTHKAIKYALSKNNSVPNWVKKVINENNVGNAAYYSNAYNIPRIL